MSKSIRTVFYKLCINKISNQIFFLYLNHTNIQVGDSFYIHYITLYNFRSTQTEDRERVRKITNALIKRLIRLQDDIRAGSRPEDYDENDSVDHDQGNNGVGKRLAN